MSAFERLINCVNFRKNVHLIVFLGRRCAMTYTTTHLNACTSMILTEENVPQKVLTTRFHRWKEPKLIVLFHLLKVPNSTVVILIQILPTTTSNLLGLLSEAWNHIWD